MRHVHRIAATTLSLIGLAGFAAAAPSLSLSPQTAEPATSVTAAVSGFPAGAPVDVYFEATKVCTVAAGASACSFEVPESALPQTHAIAARQAGAVANARLPVLASWGQAHGMTPAQNGLNRVETLITAGNAGTHIDKDFVDVADAVFSAELLYRFRTSILWDHSSGVSSPFCDVSTL